ncbi:hypothetical protein IMSAGC022_00307 [Alistipes sp.]|nr:hypothetical protein IMSAGC022_00307 [Alistipes sp.]
MPYASVGFGQQRYRTEQKIFAALLRLPAVSLHERAGKLDQRDRRTASHKQVAHVLAESGDEGLRREAAAEHVVETQQGLYVVACQQQVCHVEVGVVVQHVERGGYLLVVELRAAERYGLVEHRQGVAHTAVGLARDEVQSLIVGLDPLLRGYVSQILHAVLDAYAVEVVYLASREDRGDDLVLLGGGQNEYGVCRRLFERFEKGVERLCREHVHLVDDEHRVAPLLRHDPHLLDEVADVVDRVVRGGIELVYVQRAVVVEAAARLALVAGLCADGVLAVYRLGEDAGAGGLAHAARSAEQVGVRQLSALDRVFERRGYMFLSDDRCECRGTVFSRRNDKILHNIAKV